MSFFDRKEEVLEVQLTPYGRYLLSLGEFTPEFYSFFDDDILYDSEYAGYSEAQNTTEERIKETTRNHCQINYKTAELDASNVYVYDGKNLQNYFEREYSLNSELGISDYYSENAPAWDIDFLKGNLSTSNMVYSGSGPNYRIPQVNTEYVRYKKIVGSNNPGPDPLFHDESIRDITTYNQNFVEIRKDFLLLEINEANTVSQRENFEIEIFRVEEDTEGATSTEVLIPLKFGTSQENIVEYIDHYFNVDIDMEIDEEVLCKYKGVDIEKGAFLQGAFDCALESEKAAADQYKTRISDIGEVCD